MAWTFERINNADMYNVWLHSLVILWVKEYVRRMEEPMAMLRLQIVNFYYNRWHMT